jgi:hypothetical protein
MKEEGHGTKDNAFGEFIVDIEVSTFQLYSFFSSRKDVGLRLIYCRGLPICC